MYKPYLLLLLLLLLFVAPAFAQKQVKGKVKDAAGKPFEGASVSLKDAGGNIIKFTRTNAAGEYSLDITEANTNFTVEATFIGYKKAVIAFTSPDRNYDMILEDGEMMLKEVKIKKPPSLKTNGDTLSYRPADFADGQDRSIGDVLRRMPGIDIADDGKISYNGKSISNFYIDGDNLLDDRYNIASRSIPHLAVDEVQVIQKDQPIKMLRKNNTSENVALNLVIKNEYKLHVMGEATSGLGVPNRYEGDVTAILLNKKVKFINNLTGDNIGIDPGTDIISHSSPFAGGYFLSTDAAGNPPLPKNRYLFNNAGLINTNNLLNINKDLQLKTNIAYLYDVTHQQSQRLQENFLPGQTISYNNIQNNTINDQVLRAQFDFVENSERLYFKDVVLLDYRPITTASAFINNNIPGNQVLKQQTLGVSNVLSYLLHLRSGRIVNVSSTLSSVNKPETLFITPGIDSAIFNNSLPYAGLNQYLTLPTWRASNSGYIRFDKNKFTQTYKAGFDWQRQQLNSQLYTVQNNQTTAIALNAVNELYWMKTKLYTSGSYDYTGNKIKINLNLPLSLNLVNYKDDGNKVNQTFNKLFFDPSINFSYYSNSQNKLSINYNLNNGLGVINNVYAGAILANYQSLISNSAPLSSPQTQSIGADYEFKKATQLLFINVNANYSDMAANTIAHTLFSSNIQQNEVLPLPNHVRSLTTGANISKYIFPLAITVNAGISYNQRWSEFFQNNELFPSTSQAITYKGGLNGRIAKFITWAYNANYAVTNSETEGATTSTNTQLTQKSTLSFTTLKNVYFNVSGDYLYTHRPGQQDLKYVFADMNMNFKLVKINTDIMFSVTNIANVKTFTSVGLTANSLTTGTYNIPGRIAMLKGTFNF